MAVSNNNVKNIQFLRNGSLFGTRALALDALEENKGLVGDGSALLARYGSGDNIKTLVGFVYSGADATTVTIFDVEGADADVEALRTEINNKLGTGVTSANTATAQLAALSGDSATAQSGDTSVEGAKKYADGKIDALDYTGVTTGTGIYVTNVTESDGIVSATTATLPTVSVITTAGQPIVAVEEDKGTIAASAGTINAEYVNVTGNTFTSTTVQGALEEVNGAIGTAISGLDSTITADTGYYINKVDEVDGKLSGTTAALPSVNAISEAGKPITAVSESLGTIAASAGTINAEYVNVADADGHFTATTVEGALAELWSGYTAGDTALKGDATTSGDTLGKLEDRIEALDADAKEYSIVKITTGLPEIVKERYALQDTSGNTSGATIDIPKDSHIVSITYITDTGDTHYQNLKYEYIDASGNTQTTYVDMSELVLETEFGSGVTVTNHVAHGVVDPTSETFLTVGADGFKLDGVQDAIDTAISGLDVTTDVAVAGQYVAAIEETDGLVAVKSRANVSEAVLNNYASGDSSADIVATDTINQAFGKVENQIAAINNVVDNLDATVTGETSGSHITISIEELDGKLVQSGLTITEDNIADADDLEELSGKTVTEIGSSNSSITVATAATTADDGTVKYDVITDASKIKMSGFTSTDALSGITSSSSITDAFEEVDAVITANEQTTAQAFNDLESSKVDVISVNGVQSKTPTTGDVVASVTIDGGDITLDDYQKPAASAAITSADTVNQAIGKLEKGLEGALSGGITGITINSSGVTVSGNTASFTVEGATTAMTGSNNQAVVVDTDANGNLTIGLDTIDAGTY